jgi:hypothetical protein
MWFEVGLTKAGQKQATAVLLENSIRNKILSQNRNPSYTGGGNTSLSSKH